MATNALNSAPYACLGPAFWRDHARRDVADWLREARARTLALVADLDDRQLLGPQTDTVNPLLWEIGHVAWFQERWVLRRDGRASLRTDADALYDSSAVAHDTRWGLPLFDRGHTLRYMQEVLDAVLVRVERDSPEDLYYHLLALFHEDMHGEAFLIYRQAWGYAPPDWLRGTEKPLAPGTPGERGWGEGAGPLLRDAHVPGGELWLGAHPDEPFVFDNEKWRHAVKLAGFAMARAPVTQAEFRAFVEDDGYRRQECWSPEGWRWREQVAAEHPVYWRREADGGWLRREFDGWKPLEPHRPVINVCWYEADAYCRWAGRRLPSEAEWEAAASLAGADTNAYTRPKRRFPWGEEAPTPAHANLEARRLGCVDVADCPAGDSIAGIRQLIGNVWEWTADAFGPYPGFVADPYRDYSQPWFGDHQVLRGGCWATRARLLRNTWRNFYQPQRRDVWAGFPNLRTECRIRLRIMLASRER